MQTLWLVLVRPIAAVVLSITDPDVGDASRVVAATVALVVRAGVNVSGAVALILSVDAVHVTVASIRFVDAVSVVTEGNLSSTALGDDWAVLFVLAIRAVVVSITDHGLVDARMVAALEAVVATLLLFTPLLVRCIRTVRFAVALPLHRDTGSVAATQLRRVLLAGIHGAVLFVRLVCAVGV